MRRPLNYRLQANETGMTAATPCSRGGAETLHACWMNHTLMSVSPISPFRSSDPDPKIRPRKFEFMKGGRPFPGAPCENTRRPLL
jgi:hypothetical protein